MIEGAARVIAEHGYAAASVRFVAKEVGVSHPGLLHHFGTKESLLEAVIDSLEQEAQVRLDHARRTPSDVHDLAQLLAATWDPLSQHMKLLARLDIDAGSDTHPGRYRIARLHRVHEHILGVHFASFYGDDAPEMASKASFSARAFFSVALSHVAREQTVRRLQRNSHHDDPESDLLHLAYLLLE